MNRIRILFLASDPSDSARLRLGQEVREIRESLKFSKLRDSFVLESRESVRPKDITREILDVDPHIIHFSGHGLSSGELCFEDSSSRLNPVKVDVLESLFELVSQQVVCVVLNACYSDTQAKAIVKHIPFVIGMNQSIQDRTAIAFSSGFYKALGAGRLYEDAYKLARVEIQLEGISEELVPVLYKQKGLITLGDNSKKSRYVLILSATIGEVDKPLINAVVTHLRQISGDVSLTLKRVESGSIRLTLEGSSDGFNLLKKLIRDGELTEIRGVVIQDIELEQDIAPHFQLRQEEPPMSNKSNMSQNSYSNQGGNQNNYGGNKYQVSGGNVGHIGDNIYQDSSVSPQALLNRGIQLINQRNYTNASDVLSEAVRIDPSSSDAAYYLALSLLRGKRPKVLKRAEIEAIDQAISTAISNNPDNGTLHILRALVRHDYYDVNRLRSPSPSAMEILERAQRCDIDRNDLTTLLDRIPMENNQLYLSLKRQIS